MGLVATVTIEGGTDGDAFAVFLDEVLGPHVKSGDLVVMDNAGAHRDPRVVTVLAKYRAKPVYLPPYGAQPDAIRSCCPRNRRSFAASPGAPYSATQAGRHPPKS